MSSQGGRRAPRRRVKQRVGPSRVRWDRVGRIALVLVLFGVMVSYLNPVVNLVDAYRDSKAGETRLAELKQEHASLKEQLDSAESEQSMIREARRMGMVRPGERLHVVHKLDE